jgi:ribosomal protein L32
MTVKCCRDCAKFNTTHRLKPYCALLRFTFEDPNQPIDPDTFYCAAFTRRNSAKISVEQETPSDEPNIDDSIKFCPNCERPNQFGELCLECEREEETDLKEELPPIQRRFT